jgi:hypothetical protein
LGEKKSDAALLNFTTAGTAFTENIKACAQLDRAEAVSLRALVRDLNNVRDKLQNRAVLPPKQGTFFLKIGG